MIAVEEFLYARRNWLSDIGWSLFYAPFATFAWWGVGVLMAVHQPPTVLDVLPVAAIGFFAGRQSLR